MLMYNKQARTEGVVNSYYVIITLAVCLTIAQLVTMNWKGAISYELYYWVDYRLVEIYLLYGSLLVVEIADVILHYFFVDYIKKTIKKDQLWKSR